MLYGKIFDGERLGKNAESLVIGSARPKFFVKPILETTDFRMSSEPAVIEAKFFIGSPFERSLYVCLADSPEALDSGTGLAKVMHVPARTASDEHIKAISEFLRGSQTLKRSASTSLSDERCIIVDRGCMAYVSADLGQFKRLLLMQMYAEALLLVLETASDVAFSAAKAKDISSYKNAIEQYEELLKFHAAYYFRSAVKIDSHELSAAWAIIRDHHQLDERMEELSRKLASVAMLLKEKSDKEEAASAARAAKISNRWALFVSGLLTLLTGLTAFDFVRQPVDGFFQDATSTESTESNGEMN